MALVSKRGLVALILALGWAPAHADDQAFSRPFRPNELIIKVRDGSPHSRLRGVLTQIRAKKITRFKGTLIGFEHVALKPGADLRAALARLKADPNVEIAQPNYILELAPVPERPLRALRAPCIAPGWPWGCDNPDDDKDDDGDSTDFTIQRPAIDPPPADFYPPQSDPMLKDAAGLMKTHAIEAWNTSTGSRDVVVAVIDSGVDYNHKDLGANIWRNRKASRRDEVGWDFVHEDALPWDDKGHGTMVAGIIGAVGGNGIGISGVSPRVSLMALKTFNQEGKSDTATAIRAIDYAVSHGARVINASWGGPSESPQSDEALRGAIARAAEKEIVFVAAAGNEGANNDISPTYPASLNLPNMIAVAWSDEFDRLSRNSNYSSTSVHLSAPGQRILSTIPRNRYGRDSGTSMAAPFVSGAVALLLSSEPNLSAEEVKRRVLQSVDEIPALKGKTVTGGRLNVARLLGGATKRLP